MFSKLRKKLTAKPEPSLPLRLTILAAMLVPLLALGRVDYRLWPYVAVAALGIAAGHWYSYHHLARQNQAVRAAMFVAIHLSLCWMFVGLAQGFVVPQAQFAIFTQAVTSFDLRHRSSLFNTLILSLAILYVAASLSRTTELGLYLLLFGALVLVAFFIAEKESGLQQATVKPRPALNEGGQLRSMTLFGVSFAALTLLAIFIIFLFTPRYANRPIVPPFTLNLPLRGGVSSEIINPGLPLVQINGWSDESGEYYYGFDTNLDLRYRGGLSDALVMYVRSPSRSYWRSHSYDFYDGIRWSQSDKSLTDMEHRGVYFELPYPLGSPQSQLQAGEAGLDGRRILHHPGSMPRHIKEVFDTAADDDNNPTWQEDQQIVQTFNIVRDQPNLVFAAYRPVEIFITTERISLDRGDGLRLPEPLKAGMTYSVVSYRPEFEPERLRQLDPKLPYPVDITSRYLQLPDSISERVKRLAKTIVASHNNTFDKVSAINEHLRREYRYNFFPPPHPAGAEVVDTFLFEDREGVCEQYVTALVVLARTLGIPARLVSGYGSGEYNPVTGYYEVRYSHAHSWAEVYFPEVGWVPFDPTPGWTPQPYPTPAQNWLFANNGQLLNQLTGLQIPVATIASGSLAGLNFFMPFLVGSAILVGLVLLLYYLSRRLLQAWAARQKARYSSLADNSHNRRQLIKLYKRGVSLLPRKQYRRRQPWETIAEYARTAGPLPALVQLSTLAEMAAYRPQSPDAALVEQAKEALDKLETQLTKPDRADKKRPRRT